MHAHTCTHTPITCIHTGPPTAKSPLRNTIYPRGIPLYVGTEDGQASCALRMAACSPNHNRLKDGLAISGVVRGADSMANGSMAGSSRASWTEKFSQRKIPQTKKIPMKTRDVDSNGDGRCTNAYSTDLYGALALNVVVRHAKLTPRVPFYLHLCFQAVSVRV